MQDDENGHQILEVEHTEEVDDDLIFDDRMQDDNFDCRSVHSELDFEEYNKIRGKKGINVGPEQSRCQSETVLHSGLVRDDFRQINEELESLQVENRSLIAENRSLVAENRSLLVDNCHLKRELESMRCMLTSTKDNLKKC